MNYKEAQEKAENLYKKLSLEQVTLNETPRIIAVSHDDGSYFEFNSAAFFVMEEEWAVIVTEHHGVFVYNFDDVKWIREFSGRDLCRSDQD